MGEEAAKMSDIKRTFNFSYVWPTKASINEAGNVDIYLEGERGVPENGKVRERVAIVIHNCCGVGNLVHEVMAAHERNVQDAISDRDAEKNHIFKNLTVD